MGHLFYSELGNRGLFDLTGTERADFYDENGEIVVQNTSPFANLLLGDIWTPALYWSSTEHALNTDGAWGFSTSYGFQEVHAKANYGYYAMAVHAGNVGGSAPVPEPGTILAALSILGPAGFMFRRRKLV
jgi:hypothetical protein